MVDYELNELKREFLDEARGKVSEMESALGETNSPEALDRMAYLAHQLKGSGGSYGYQRISTDAAALEKTLETVASGGNDGLQQKIRQYVEGLRSEIDRCAAELAQAS